ncbi:MAG TPA: hypothetical protein PLX89_05505 [Verrucomicrobiota bacterium]|nr:hypothetical protein [Verrucomicrobiales bacterium]HRI12443.1 hypothetical protein [Verrucomicrobiota bacterium]
MNALSANPPRKSLIALSVLASLLPTLAQSGLDPNRFQASARLSFNVDANVGPLDFGNPNPGPPVGHGINRNYDDGYVRVDSEGNAGGLTWYWGYRDASQVPGNDTLHMNSSGVSGAGTTTLDSDGPGLGAEIAWLRDLHRTEHFSFGTKVAGSYTRFDFSSSTSQNLTLTRLTDTYDLGGIVPPGDPTKPGYQYAGIYDLPGPVIPDEPTSRETTTIPGGASNAGSRDLTTDMWAFKLGAWVEHEFGHRFSAQLGGGFAFAVVDASLSYSETLSWGESDLQRYSSSESHTQVVVGGYIEAALYTRITQQLDLVFAAELMPLTSYSENLAGREVELDFGTAWSLNLGFSYRF